VRLAGTIDNELHATVFRDYLFNRGIECDVEASASGDWSIWVHDEDKLADVTVLLQSFKLNPDDAVWTGEAESGSARRRAEEKKQAQLDRAARRSRAFDSFRFLNTGSVTLFLIVLSVVVTVLLYSPYGIRIKHTLVMHFPSIESGQLWRIITPVFMHFRVLHILFNMLWLKDLGSMIESIRGKGFLCLFVAVAAGLSNAAEYLMSGPNFGGMSGVVYGMLGYVWLQSRLNPWSGFVMHPFTMQMMMIWFVLGLSGIIGTIANGTHAVGLLVGLAWGYIDAKRSSS